MSRFTKITASLLAVVALAGCTPGDEPVSIPDFPIKIEVQSDEPTQASTSENAVQALAALETITVDVTPFLGEYDREGQFGDAWLDMDANHCDTRNDILARDLTNIVGDTDGCKVYSGVLADPYTGETINFVRGRTSSQAVQIDHIIPLHYAIQRGADGWDQHTRMEFANDPANLIAVDGSENSIKSDKGPSRWMVPSNPDYRCTYATQWVTVLDKYDLEVRIEDKMVLEKTLKGC